MAWNLAGRAALITGGGSGIGAELARRLGARGMRLGLIDLDGDALSSVAERVPGAETVVADVRDAASLRAAVSELAERLGGIDVAVANAGVGVGGPMRMIGPDSVELTLEINLLGVWRTVHAALPFVLERRGHILLVASGAAFLASPGLGAYGASKAGVEMLGRTLRIELRPHGVTVGVAYFLFLNTPMVTETQESRVVQATKRRAPSFITRIHPVEPAVARVVGSIEKRSRAVFYPPWLRGVSVARGLLDNPLLDRALADSVPDMDRAFATEAEELGADAAARGPRWR
jgi:NAD(P)-dependent dehydrogenase (short-subunit alcohol dehydrogenase family)